MHNQEINGKAPIPSNGTGSTITFSRFAAQASSVVGSSGIFISACVLIIVWLLSGPWFHYSDTWQLIVNTATTIVTFLMVFLIQNTQNRDTRAINLKLDEIIRSLHRADNEMINIEKLGDEELEELAKRYELIRAEYDHRAAEEQAERNLPAA